MSRGFCAYRVNACHGSGCYSCNRGFGAEWAGRRGLKPVDLARELNADKSVVSRWYSGASPSEEYQKRLAALFDCEPGSLLQHPDDDWLSRFFRGREQDEIARIKATLEAAFPKKTG